MIEEIVEVLKQSNTWVTKSDLQLKIVKKTRCSVRSFDVSLSYLFNRNNHVERRFVRFGGKERTEYRWVDEVFKRIR